MKDKGCYNGGMKNILNSEHLSNLIIGFIVFFLPLTIVTFLV